MIPMVARKAFRYAGQQLKPGETFVVQKRTEAQILRGTKRAIDAPPPEVSVSSVLALPTVPVNPVTQDARETDAPLSPEPTDTEPVADPPTEDEPKGKRRYRRRDVVAEDPS